LPDWRGTATSASRTMPGDARAPIRGFRLSKQAGTASIGAA
jgi:hypothetical protein